MKSEFEQILALLNSGKSLTDKERQGLMGRISELEKEYSTTQFKLERTQKVKKTTAVLLEETIAELEKKNKEAQVEAALERIRSKTNAMQESSQLAEVNRVVFQEAISLGFGAKACDLVILDKEAGASEFWISGELDSEDVIHFKVPRFRHKHYQDGLEAWKKQEEIRHVELKGNSCKSYMRNLVDRAHESNMPMDVGLFLKELPSVHHTEAYMQYGYFRVAGVDPLSQEEQDILKRFAKVFEQTYTRFLDLQKAEAQAREAQIEVALERVRAASMAMHKSEELPQVAQVLLEQLEHLGVSDLDCGINVVNPDTKNFISYSASSIKESNRKEFHQFPQLNLNDIGFLRKTIELVDAGRTQFTLELRDELYQEIMNIWDKYGYPGLRNRKDFDATGVVYLSVAQFDRYSSVSTTSLSEMTEEKMLILQRMAQTFGMSYTRFLDLQKAEAQAREAQIEAALERVRTRSMAMHNSDELQEVIKVVFDQIKVLGLVMDSAQFDIFEEGSNDSNGWIATKGYQYAERIKTHYFKSPVFDTYLKAKRKKPSTYTMSFSKSEKDKYWKHVFKHTDLSRIPSKRKKYLLSSKGLDQTGAILNDLSLSINNYKGIYYSEDETVIIRRFAEVFDQTYTRFLDLQKAEAQAREAHIEAALERVRSRSMAMHKSEELVEVATVLHKELRSLNVHEFSETSIVVHDEPSQKLIVWGARTGSSSLEKSVFPLLGDQILQKLYDKWRQQEDFYTLKIEGAALRKHIDFVFPKASRTEQEDEAIKSMPDPTFFHCAFYCMGYLELMSDKDLTEDSSSLLTRFAKVFDQTYTRFLDLQKAEAQAREAEIEASLERVRSASLAMHKTSELQKVINTVHKQFTDLSVDITGGAFIAINSEMAKEITCWGAGGTANYVEQVQIPIFNRVIYANLIKNIKAGPGFFTESYSEKQKLDFFNHMFKNPPYNKASAKHKKEVLSRKGGYARSCFVSELTSVFIINHHGREFSAEDNMILQRVGTVFAQTYTRFLDLQKAEAQAREAQIETALERVRSRSMAMHMSEELQEVIKVVFDQISSLGIAIDSAQFDIFEKGSNDINGWIATNDYEYANRIRTPYFKSPVIDEYHKFKKKRPCTYNISHSKAEKDRYFNHAFKHTELLNIPDKRKKMLLSRKGLVQAGAILKDLSLGINNYDGIAFMDYDVQIIRRFADVFDQTYTRFLDLKKAEAHAREAQIEAALERVRASTMAMHKSEDVGSATVLLFDQLTELGVISQRCGIAIPRGSKHLEFWAATTDKKGKSMIVKGDDPLDIHPALQKAYKSWKSKKGPRTYVLKDDDLIKYYQAVRLTMPLPEWQRKMHSKKGGREDFSTFPFSDGWIYIFTEGSLTDESYNVLPRFAQLFDLTYRRYLDLQKAEAQAREAQIEAALERVRSKSMAMHKSEELAGLSLELVKQVQNLGVATWFCAFNIYDEDSKGSLEWGSNGEGTFPKYRTPREGIFLRYYQSGQRGETLLINEIGENECPSHYEYLCSLPGVGKQLLKMKESGISFPTSQIDHVAYFKYGYVLFITFEPAPEAHEIFKRFAKVFEQSYTRFLDIKKAEAQAQEAQIEAALERVRARSMAMHKTAELEETSAVLFEQLEELGIIPWRCGTAFLDDSEKYFELWSATKTPEGKIVGVVGETIIKDNKIIKGLYSAIKKKDPVYIYDLTGKQLTDYLKYVSKNFEITATNTPKVKPPKRLVYYCQLFDRGALYSAFPSTISEQELQILQRFSKTFQQTYTRFLDLEKAEAQAREAQIEAALERVRARSMAMHHAEELDDVSAVVYEELKKLGIENFESCGVHIIDEENEAQQFWGFHIDLKQLTRFQMPLKGDSILNARYTAWKKGESYFYQIVGGKKLNDHLEYTSPEGTELGSSSSWIEEFGFPDPTYFHFANFPHGYLHIIAAEALPEEHHNILIRFAKVFEQTYTRFLDLQKVEAQAREAKIEAALERVRSASMAMNSTEDLQGVSAVVYKELKVLGIASFESCGFHIVNEEDMSQDVWSFHEDLKQLTRFKMPLKGDTILNNRYKAWKSGDPFTYQQLGDEKLNKHLTFTVEDPISLGDSSSWIEKFGFPNPTHFHFANFSQGYLQVVSAQALSEELSTVLVRFAKVFEQAYTRFLDLKKAEKQAHEAQIEAALEKVRSRTMGMQSSEELPEVANLMFFEIQSLGIPAWSCGYNILASDKKSATCWMSSEGALQKPFTLRLFGEASFVEMGKFIRSRKTMMVQELGGTALIEHYDYMKSFVDLQPTFKNLEEKGLSLPTFQINHLCKFSRGFLLFITYEQVPESHDLFRRFTNVFDQTYTRFLDLKKAEAQALETLKQSSLDRVRGEIASMRTADDLNRITPLVWRELTTLDVPFFRCGVFIMDEVAGIVHTYLSTPSGESLAALHLDFHANALSEAAFSNWKKQKIHKEEWDQKQFKIWTKSLVQQGLIQNTKTYQHGEEAPQRLVLHLVPFTQGMLYVGSSDFLAEDQVRLVQSLADSFAVAYARYEDFKELEQAKEQVEGTLTELKSTQDQLVHSEKMASLGELTAGIAHEIQNPLNFVNNFSDVNKELAEELLEEINNGNGEEAESIIKDIIENEEKILHHGQRAEEIVRSMLLHSRGSTGEKELTDVNTLADEYLRLAYHGMRAKDKSFNADFQLELEEDLPKLYLVQQDIGRVLLNLINNAFYATNEKSRKLDKGEDYKATVAVSTALISSSPASNTRQVRISVKDNGSGIPKNVVEKIFQPFYTTKPTGKGTGLGLSLSYDIITKGHGGEIEVKSNEGEGTEFVILLPDFRK